MKAAICNPSLRGAAATKQSPSQHALLVDSLWSMVDSQKGDCRPGTQCGIISPVILSAGSR